MANKDRTACEARTLPRSDVHQAKPAAFGIGSTLFRQAEPADCLFYVESGQVKLAVTSAQGKEAIVGVFVPGDFFGEGCLVSATLRQSTATALTTCRLVRIDRAPMIRILAEDPSFAAVFMRHLLARKTRVEEDLVDQLFNSSEKRLARTLLLLANVAKGGDPQPITTPVSQETLAEIVGTTRSRVSHFMNKFRKLGYIEYQGHPCVENSPLRIHGSLESVLLRD